MVEGIRPRFGFTASDLAMLNSLYPRGRHYCGPIGDVFAVAKPRNGLPWLIVSRRGDGSYVTINPVEGTRVAMRSLDEFALGSPAGVGGVGGPPADLDASRQPAGSVSHRPM